VEPTVEEILQVLEDWDEESLETFTGVMRKMAAMSENQLIALVEKVNADLSGDVH
jgi:hypothetical protein